MNFPSVSQFSVAKGTGGTNPPEMYIPLWWYSGSSVNTSLTSSNTSIFLMKASLGFGSTASTASKLHTLNSNWLTTQKFAFEASMYGSASITAFASLYDITSGTVVTSVSTNSSSFTIVRSGQFTLTPGHVYGVQFYSGTSGSFVYLTDASLIVFPQ